MAQRYIVVQVQIVGNAERWQHVYYSDLAPYSTRQAAIHHGMRMLDHDDFLLGVLRGDRLAGLAWQYDDRDYSDPDDTEGNRNELHEAAEQLGLALTEPDA